MEFFISRNACCLLVLGRARRLALARQRRDAIGDASREDRTEFPLRQQYLAKQHRIAQSDLDPLKFRMVHESMLGGARRI
jgi:hypothetical protein